MSLERKYVPCEASSGVVGTCVWKERVVRVCVTRFSVFPRYRLGAFQLLCESRAAFNTARPSAPVSYTQLTLPTTPYV